MQVVDAASGDAAQGRKAAGVRIEQHLVALTGVGHQPEGSAGAQLQVRNLHAVVDAAHHQSLFAPVELEGLAKLEDQGHESASADELALLLAPMANEVGQPRVAAGVAKGCELNVQRAGGPALMLGTVRVNFQRLCERIDERRELGRHIGASVLRRRPLWGLQPLLDRVA